MYISSGYMTGEIISCNITIAYCCFACSGDWHVHEILSPGRELSQIASERDGFPRYHPLRHADWCWESIWAHSFQVSAKRR